MDDLSVIINLGEQVIRSPSYLETLSRVCKKIETDNWTYVNKGVLGHYMEIKSYDKSPKLKGYTDDFASLEFKMIDAKIINNHPLYSLKFKGYEIQPYLYEDNHCKILFIYGVADQLTTPESKTLNDLRREMLSIMSQLQQIMSGQRPNEIAILKMQQKDLSAI